MSGRQDSRPSDGATTMIIQCPNCGFSGRIPRYALTVPHLARCLRCRHEFEPGSLVPGGTHAHAPAPPAGADFGPPGPGRGGDPGSSSYELQAITDELAASVRTVEGDDPWDSEGEEDRAVPGGKGRAFPKVAAPPDGASGITPPPRLGLVSRMLYGPADPWYSRVLQAWGGFFLIWALAILGRSLHHLATARDFATSGREILSSVVS